MKITTLLEYAERSQLRAWLEENHAKEKECWVVMSRSKIPPAGVLPYVDVVEEALCFGWIDSTLKKLPDGRLAQRLSPRRRKSHWTRLNIDRCTDLEKRGLMTEAGRIALSNATRINIRKAQKEDASQIAELFMLAWPVEDILNSNGITYDQLHKSITEAAASEQTIYSYENTYIAETEGKIVGAMCAYDGADYQRLKQPIVDIIGKDSMFAHLKETEAGEFYLDSVGVLEEYRGRGIASKLFAAQIERARTLGHTWAGLIVDEDKPQAEALYTRLGFRHIDQKDFFGHAMKHMVINTSANIMNKNNSHIIVAPSDLSYAEAITSFQVDMAIESEGLSLDYQRTLKGVQSVLQDENKGRYILALIDGKPVGSLMLTREWSDWNCCWYLWIQSVYVLPAHRNKGIFKSMYSKVLELAKSEEITQVRLYVDKDNKKAQTVYQKLGMSECHYLMYEVEL